MIKPTVGLGGAALDILVSVVLPLGLAFIMFSLGVGLTPADFWRVGQRPVAFGVGALHQIILLPLVAWACIWIFGIERELAVGIMILSVCPGGVTSNIVSKLGGGDVALSVSLTAVISLTSVVTVPLVLAVSMRAFMGDDAPAIDITSTAITMFALTVVPMGLGLLARRMAPVAMSGAERGISAVATGLFAVIVVAAVAANWSLFINNLSGLGPAIVTLVFSLSCIGYVVPRLLGRTRVEAKTISVETGIQNATLGIAVAAIIVGGQDGLSAYAVPSAVYGVFMYVVMLPIVILVFRRIP